LVDGAVRTDDRVLSLLSRAARLLEEGGVPHARLNAERLLSGCTGMGRAEMYAHPERKVARREVEAFDAFLERRLAGEPLQYILGEAGFRRLVLAVDGRVMIPRPETEVLVERALQRMAEGGSPPLVVDMGTGSGCIALSVAVERPDAEVHAVDVSPAALEVARENAVSLGLEKRIVFHRGDLFSALPEELKGRCGFVLCNPPYVAERDFPVLPREVREHEPRIALLAGPRGWEVQDRLLEEAREWLSPGGWLLVEGSGEQVSRLEARARELGYAECGVVEDLTGRDRFLEAR
jgi:release factor glutamine methyltransferase